MSTIMILMTYPELIKLIGGWIVELDIMRASLDRDSSDRKKLDTCRDQLDTCQRTLVRWRLDVSTAAFQAHTQALVEVNKKLETTFDDMAKLAKTLKSLVEFVNVVEKLVKLIPK